MVGFSALKTANPMSVRGSVLLIALFFAAMQGFVLPPDGFVTGDQGSKFLQTRAFAMHGPLNPSIDVAARDIDPDYRRQEPKLKNRRGRLVSEFLWLLPLLSAPFFAVFGMRGLYVVPALSAIVVFLAAAALGRRMGEPSGVWTACIAVMATPVVVYGLELWEHAPAAACVIVAAVLTAPWRPPDAGRLPPKGGSYILAGAAIMAGFLFREEVITALPAFAIARALSVERDRLKELVTTGLWMGLGAAAVFLASMPMNLLIYGAPLPMHVTQDAWEVAKNTPYLQVRRDVIVDLLLPASHTALFVIACMAGLAATLAHAWRRPRTDEAAPDDRALLMVVHAAVGVVLMITVALPIWRLVQGVRPHDAYRVTSAAHTWPFVLAILYWPWVAGERERPLARFLIVSALLLLAGSALIVPTSGGAQWGPRFLIAVAPLLAIVAALAGRPPGAGTETTAAIAWMARGILLASLVMQASGVFYVQRAKARNATLTHWLAARTAPGDAILTDIFWFHEVTATLAPTRRQLFSWSAGDIPAMASMAVAQGRLRFSIASSLPLTGYEPPAALDVPGAPCRFVRGQQIGLDNMGLLLRRYGCEGF